MKFTTYISDIMKQSCTNLFVFECFQVGRDADSWVAGNCTGGAASPEFTPEEFYGLCIMSGIMLAVGLVISVFERLARIKAARTVSPEDSKAESVTPEMRAAVQAGVEAGIRASMKVI